MTMYRFSVLGDLEVRRDGTPLTIVRTKPRLLLACLLVNANRPVGLDGLVDEMWVDPPKSAVANLRTYTRDLRRLLGPGGPLVTRPGGYELAVGSGEFDLAEYERMVADGQAALRRGSHAEAVRLLGAADRLWRGRAFCGLRDAPTLHALALTTESLRSSAREWWAEARLGSGGDPGLVTYLRRYLASHPLRERGWETLMRALVATGDVAGALDAYQDARASLAGELGIEPGPELRRLHAAILGRGGDTDHQDRLASRCRDCPFRVRAGGLVEVLPQRRGGAIPVAGERGQELLHDLHGDRAPPTSNTHRLGWSVASSPRVLRDAVAVGADRQRGLPRPFVLSG